MKVNLNQSYPDILMDIFCENISRHIVPITANIELFINVVKNIARESTIKVDIKLLL